MRYGYAPVRSGQGFFVFERKGKTVDCQHEPAKAKDAARDATGSAGILGSWLFIAGILCYGMAAYVLYHGIQLAEATSYGRFNTTIMFHSMAIAAMVAINGAILHALASFLEYATRLVATGVVSVCHIEEELQKKPLSPQ